ncbi:MAG: HU family DNA-binding protein [Gammaproteobacteria bacterium WSBS_2016_MAG_OTU1]
MNEENTNKLTRRDIARRLRDEIGSLSEAYNFTQVFFDELANAIAQNDKVKIHNFGSFRCLRKKSRSGRNPKTGEAATITARRVVSFAASDTLKSHIAKHGNDS